MSAGADERPFPPGEYPCVVVGSGPGGLQVAYWLRRFGVPFAHVSADESPGGMFRRWPFFQRLLSWTKPYAPAVRGTREYERYDWNSLVADEPDARALQPTFMDGSSYFPSRPEMQQNLETFAERAAIGIRFGCRWERTRREDDEDGSTFVLETSDGEYRTRVLVLAVGVAEPFTPDVPGAELVRHYSDTRGASSYAGKRLFVLGKQNSGFELASGLAPWASRIVIASPSPAKLSVMTRSLVGVRARYVQPFEDHYLGFGVSILDASIEQIAHLGEAYRVDLRRSDNGMPIYVEADEVIACTGFTCPLQDLPDIGVSTFGQSRLPALDAFWESIQVPGIYFAGTITQASAGLKKHGVPANSGAVHGHRYNGRVLARHIAERRFGLTFERPAIPEAELLGYLLSEATSAPELWHQKAYLARVVELDPSEGPRDAGIQPLTHVLDAGGPDAVVMTVEADGAGGINPVVYIRTSGRIEEHPLDGNPLLDFATRDHQRQLGDVLARLLPAYRGAA